MTGLYITYDGYMVLLSEANQKVKDLAQNKHMNTVLQNLQLKDARAEVRRLRAIIRQHPDRPTQMVLF